MTTKRRIAVTLAALATCFLLSSVSYAQTKVAIVDIGKVFKGHPSFTRALDTLKSEADAFKANNIKAQQDLMAKAEGLKSFKPGSPDYAKAESQLAQESATLEVKSRNRMRELMLQEARLHFDTYQQVQSVIEAYCDSQEIQLVLRYNSEKLDPNNAQSVMQKVNSFVVYNQSTNDITDVIIRQLAGQANAGGGVQR